MQFLQTVDSADYTALLTQNTIYDSAWMDWAYMCMNDRTMTVNGGISFRE